MRLMENITFKIKNNSCQSIIGFFNRQMADIYIEKAYGFAIFLFSVSERNGSLRPMLFLADSTGIFLTEVIEWNLKPQ